MDNYHVILVHFPIAFLTIYSLAELLRFRELNEQPFWFYVKAVLVTVGVAAGYPTMLAGALIKKGFDQGALHPIVLTHATMAVSTIVFFSIIAVGYLVTWIHRTNPNWGSASSLFRGLTRLSAILQRPQVQVALAVLGLGMVTLTGALGGIIAFGSDTDPLARTVYNLLFR